MTTARDYYVFCQDVFKIYKIADLEVVALRGLDLAVEPGEVVAIVGASGSGKSTLLNILAGYDAPSAGSVMVGGKDLLRMNGRDIEEYRREDIGFIWQQTSRNLFPYLTTHRERLPPHDAHQHPRRRETRDAPRNFSIWSDSDTGSTTRPKSCPAESSSASP